MESKAKLAGHPAHQILIVFPLGLLLTSFIFDCIYLVNGVTALEVAAYWMITAGLVGGLVAAVPGLIDWLAIPASTRAKKIGLYHGVGNVVVLVLFGLSWWLRMDAPDHIPHTLDRIISFLGFALAGLTGWLGGELVDRLGVGVEPDANLNAPNSLSGRPAAGNASTTTRTV